MNDHKLTLLTLHPCAEGLERETLEEIAEAGELIDCDAGDVIHQRENVQRSVFLIIHGRLKVTAFDPTGKPVMMRYMPAGSQFGGLGASLAEPLPVECVAEDPSVLIRYDYDVALQLTKQHDRFRTNFARVISTAVKETLFNKRSAYPAKLVAILHQCDETREIRDRVLDRLVELGETPLLLTDQITHHEGIVQRKVPETIDEATKDEIAKQIAEHVKIGRTILDVRSNFDPERASRAMVACEQVFWCVTPSNWRESIEHLQRLEARAPSWRDKISLVWLLRQGEEAPLASELRALCKRDFKIRFDGATENEGPAVTSGLNRLVQFFRGIQIGIALGGGAARGMAHLGVLQALEESGITVDMIAGTSAGAMTGTLYASGFDSQYLVQRFMADLKPSWLFRCLPHGDQWYLLYKYRSGQFDPMLRKYLGEKAIEQLTIPMHAITVDLISGRAVVREAGDAVRSIVESINLPVLSTPIKRQGEALVDGGLINNVPADVLTSKGCNFVIAISVTAKMELEFAKNRPDTPTEEMRSASTIQTLLRSYLVQSHSVNSLGVQPADYVIEPDVCEFDLTEFTRTDELSAIGRQATLDAIPQIRALLHRIDAQLYPSTNGS